MQNVNDFLGTPVHLGASANAGESGDSDAPRCVPTKCCGTGTPHIARQAWHPAMQPPCDIFIICEIQVTARNLLSGTRQHEFTEAYSNGLRTNNKGTRA